MVKEDRGPLDLTLLIEEKDKSITDLKKDMHSAAAELKFEEAADIRDKISELEKIDLEIN